MAGGSESVGASAAIANTEDGQATVYQTNCIGYSFSYTFGPSDGIQPGATYTVSITPTLLSDSGQIALCQVLQLPNSLHAVPCIATYAACKLDNPAHALQQKRGLLTF